MKTQTVREELQAIQEQIDTINYLKTPLQKAFEEEQKRDPLAWKPSDLKDMNSQLFFLYEQRNGLLAANPELQKEYGKPGGKKKQAAPSSGLKTKSQLAEADRTRRKKLIHPDFKDWCAAQDPQVKFSLDTWETDKVRGMFKADQESRTRASREAEAARLAEQKAAEAKALGERQAELAAIPQAFRSFLAEMGEPQDDDRLVGAFHDNDTNELFKLWSSERA